MKENKVLDNALKIIGDNYSSKLEHDSELNLIQELFEEGFDVKDPSGAKKINSKMLQQAIWRTVNKMKFLDFQIHGSGRPEILEKVVTDGVWTVAEEGNLTSSLRDKQGAFWSAAIYGDGFIMIGTDLNSKYPIQFTPVSSSNLYVDSYATGLRSGGVGKNVTRCAIVFSMSLPEAEYRYGDQFPKIKKLKGKIKRQTGMGKEQERTFLQEERTDKEMVEIAYYYDINKKDFLIFAGSEHDILKQESGDKYPFIKEGKPYIPLSQFVFQPSSEGFWNHGIGHMLYDLAIITRRLMNMAIGHIDENVFPITLVNIPKGEAAAFFNKLKLAHEMRAANKKGMVAMEYDPNAPGSERVSSDALLTPSLMNEWQVVFDRLDRELARLGINLDDVDRGSNITASQIIVEEENVNAFVKQVMEYNASECQFLIEIVMDFIRKFIKKTDNTPLNLTTNLALTDVGEIDLKGVTMGALADELKKFKYFVKVNARSGALPSNIMKIAQVTRQMGYTPPGSPAYVKLWQIFAGLNDLELRAEDFVPAQMPEAEPTEAMPTETDQTAINPFTREKTIA